MGVSPFFLNAHLKKDRWIYSECVPLRIVPRPSSEDPSIQVFFGLDSKTM